MDVQKNIMVDVSPQSIPYLPNAPYGPPPAPVAQVNVITQQSKAVENGYRDWHDGLCGCANDCFSCLCTAFCYPCMVCHMYRKYDECCPLLCVMQPELILNVMHRSRHRIYGSVINDCCTFCFCAPCALCRLYRDMEYVQRTKGTLL
ncbi:unnamed protein product [Calicophoron daubneyi]|uniref:Uncharacterized protein n=1 Tax=Calicophoron daubneyi TaxID=300641 RepID=A0AAV2TGQ7_CALDB